MESKITQNPFGPKNEMHKPNHGDDTKVSNSKYKAQHENNAHQLSYHTVKSKTICEKRDLNNMSLFQNKEPANLGYNINGNKLSSFSTLYEGGSTFPHKENGHNDPSKFYQNDLIHNYNDRQCQNEATSNQFISKVEDRKKCKGELFSFLCKTNISTIICWISCLFCVLYTMHLSLYIEVTIVRLTT